MMLLDCISGSLSSTTSQLKQLHPDPEIADEHSVGSKQAGSLEPVVSTRKQQKADEAELPWSIQEGL